MQPAFAYRMASSLPMPELAPIITTFLFKEDIISKAYNGAGYYQQKKNADKSIAFQQRQAGAQSSANAIANSHGQGNGI